MAVAENPFLRWEVQDLLHPQFTRVLKGYDAEEVEAYVRRIVDRIQMLEEELRRAKEERDAATRRYASVKDEAYRQVAGRMARVLRAAEELSDTLRREAEEEADRRLAEATERAQGLLHEAELEAHRVRQDAELDARRLRQEGEESLRQAREEADRILGTLEARRATLLAELSGIRDRVLAVLDELDAASPERFDPAGGEPGPPAEEGSGGARPEVLEDFGSEELIDLSQELEVMLPTNLWAGSEGQDRPAEDDEGQS